MQTYADNSQRIGALAAVLGGLLWAAKAFYDRNDAPPWPTDLTDTLFFVVPLLLLVALVGLYARCRGRLGADWEAVSFGAFVVGAAGLAASITGLLTMTFEVGPLWWIDASWMMFVSGFFMGNLGLVFFGTSVLQSPALGRWGLLLLGIGALGILLILVSDPPNSELGVYPALTLWVLYGLGWAALGYVLTTGDRSPAGSSASAGPGTDRLEEDNRITARRR